MDKQMYGTIIPEDLDKEFSKKVEKTEESEEVPFHQYLRVQIQPYRVTQDARLRCGCRLQGKDDLQR